MKKPLVPDVSPGLDADSLNDFEQALDLHNSRSQEARNSDIGKRSSKLTTDYDKYKQDPGKFDFQGVDTPEQKGPTANNQRRQGKIGLFVRDSDGVDKFDVAEEFGISESQALGDLAEVEKGGDIEFDSDSKSFFGVQNG